MKKQWDETLQLAQEWDTAKKAKPFSYEDFKFVEKDFMRVEPQAARFLFHLQSSLKPLIKHYAKNNEQLPQGAAEGEAGEEGGALDWKDQINLKIENEKQMAIYREQKISD
jgi:hypothetical protein